MKIFVQVVLLLIVAVIAIKVLPLIFGLGWLLAGAALGLLAIGASATMVLMAAGFVIVAVLSPVWVPMLVIVGLILLIKRSTRHSGALMA